MNPLDLVPKSAMLVVIAVLAATSFKLHWDKNGLVIDLEIDKTKVAQLEGAIDKANATAAMQTAALTTQVLKAQNEAKKREVILVADAAAAKSALNSLRESTSQARATYSLTSVPSYASTELTDTALQLLDQCSERYTVLAATTDRYTSYIQEVTQAWPVAPTTVK